MSKFFLFSAPLIGYEFLKFDRRKKKKNDRASEKVLYLKI